MIVLLCLVCTLNLMVGVDEAHFFLQGRGRCRGHSYALRCYKCGQLHLPCHRCHCIRITSYCSICVCVGVGVRVASLHV